MNMLGAMLALADEAVYRGVPLRQRSRDASGKA